jgi:ABC-type uncharacterized transport system permease subunit
MGRNILPAYMLLGNALAISIASGVDFSERAVIIDVAMEGTALFSSW